MLLLPKFEDLYIEENDELASVGRTLPSVGASNDVEPSTHHRRAEPTRAPVPSI